MDWDECCEIEGYVVGRPWAEKYAEMRKTKLCGWVSNFHPEKLSCHTDGPDIWSDKCGSYNWVCKVRFGETGETWAVRFPRGGKVFLPDEKIEAEVAAITTIRQNTNIPLPEIKAWGRSCDNELGLGPFIISAWVDGISLGDVLKKPKEEGDSPGRLIREDIPDATIEHLWRQIARFMLQLSLLDFGHIDSCAANPRRPLTIKSHQILECGGVGVPGPVSRTFSSSIDYFNHIADHDLKHLREQENSIDDEEDARQKYINWNVVRQLVPRFVYHENGPFKLICDDFGPMNMMVNNAQDLQIVALIDWEWSYAGPQELFWSPPLWLLGQHPACWEAGSNNHHVLRYFKYLDIYIQVMQEEEKKVMPSESNEHLPSTLLRNHQQDGSMWFHHIMHEAFNGPTSVPFSRLRASIPDFEEIAARVSSQETEAFVKEKMEDLERYRHKLAEMRQRHSDLLNQLGLL